MPQSDATKFHDNSLNRLSLPLHALKHFEVAARLGSFKKAAAELSVTPGAVSQQIRELETFLNAPLFKRGVREVTLTEVGRRLSVISTRTISDLSRAVRDIRQPSDGSGELRVEVGPYFSHQFLVPRLAKFTEEHPNIEINLQHTRSELNYGIDISIRWGKGKWSQFASEKLLDVYMQPVRKAIAGQDLAGSHEDLTSWRLLHCQKRDDWRWWLQKNGYNVELARLGPIVDDPNIAYQAAAEGLGCGLAYLPLIKGDLHIRGIEFAHPSRVLAQDAYYLLRPAGAHSKVAGIFCRWLKAEAAAARLAA